MAEGGGGGSIWVNRVGARVRAGVGDDAQQLLGEAYCCLCSFESPFSPTLPYKNSTFILCSSGIPEHCWKSRNLKATLPDVASKRAVAGPSHSNGKTTCDGC